MFVQKILQIMMLLFYPKAFGFALEAVLRCLGYITHRKQVPINNLMRMDKNAYNGVLNKGPFLVPLPV